MYSADSFSFSLDLKMRRRATITTTRAIVLNVARKNEEYDEGVDDLVEFLRTVDISCKIIQGNCSFFRLLTDKFRILQKYIPGGLERT